MSYRYESHRDWPLSDEGQRQLLRVRDRAFRLIDMAGAARMDRLIGGETGDSWNLLACVDRLLEIGDLLEIPNPHHPWGADRIFIRQPKEGE